MNGRAVPVTEASKAWTDSKSPLLVVIVAKITRSDEAKIENSLVKLLPCEDNGVV
jgi:hypothetical protein